MNVIGITKDEQESILKMLGVVLWLGNIPFSEAKDKATVSNKETLDWVANLLAVPPAALQQSLEIRSMETKKGGGARGTNYVNYLKNSKF